MAILFANEPMFDITDLADWELSVEVELSLIAIPSLTQLYSPKVA